ncbi:hypothetical protein LZG04_26475 [Saccharothrix sp. S26]|uniref:hypothetical protein n=1 Tax=Saccharothrix sp. S26 TaxID=2907215 RepID=UPI001F3E15B0|nr:hypothetical protein [Saccharothrix sp. S26]MCE6998317.1 hypothetical protein [Saccharothrix sp. S26]
MSRAESPVPAEPRQIRPVPVIDSHSVPITAATTTADFARCLDQVRVLAGPLSHRAVESRSGGRLRRTKIGQVLGGELPNREFLLVYLRVCGVAEALWPVWQEVWARLTTGPLTGVATAAPDTGTAERAETVLERAEAQATEIRRIAHAQAADLLDRTRADLDRAEARDQERIRLVEEERDGAFSRAHALADELNALHETSMERIRAADDERDTALIRARDLALELNQLHQSSMERIRAAEQERDNAITRASRLATEVDTLYAQIASLREQLSISIKRHAHDENALGSARLEIVGLRNQLDRIGRPAGTDWQAPYAEHQRKVRLEGEPLVEPLKAAKPIIGE